MTRCEVGMCVGKHRQTKHVPNELTFLLWKHQFRLAVWNEPRHAPSPAFLDPPAGLSTGGTTWLTAPSLPLSLPLSFFLSLSDILTASSGYQHQDTATPGPLSELTSDSSSRWPDGILEKYTAALFPVWNIGRTIKIKLVKTANYLVLKGLSVNLYSLYAGSVFPTETKHYTYFACYFKHSLSWL